MSSSTVLAVDKGTDVPRRVRTAECWAVLQAEEVYAAAVSFVRGPAVVLAAIVIATLVPAWRAARTNPLTALRHE